MVLVRVNDRDYQVSTIFSRFDDSLLPLMPWFGDAFLSDSFANAVNTSLGSPNLLGPFEVGPYFPIDNSVNVRVWFTPANSVTYGQVSSSSQVVYAVASEVQAVPFESSAFPLIIATLLFIGVFKWKQSH